MDVILRIGARGSPLSMAQTGQVRDRLASAMGVAPARLAILAFTTSGDQIQDRRLIEAGGKGLFTKELDEALLDGRIDCAIHSMKDLPTRLPDGIVLAATPEREDPRDAFVSPYAQSLANLPEGATVGTASLRRQAQTLFARPDLKVATLRGNVDTRLRKIAQGEAHATYLAIAGLKRLGLAPHATALVDLDAMPPAAGQGALAITARAVDARVLESLSLVHEPRAGIPVSAERAFLEALDGSCRTPIAAHARWEEGRLRLLGEALTPDGRRRWRGEESAAIVDDISARALGLDLGGRIAREAGDLLVKEA